MGDRDGVPLDRDVDLIRLDAENGAALAQRARRTSCFEIPRQEFGVDEEAASAAGSFEPPFRERPVRFRVAAAGRLNRAKEIVPGGHVALAAPSDLDSPAALRVLDGPPSGDGLDDGRVSTLADVTRPQARALAQRRDLALQARQDFL